MSYHIPKILFESTMMFLSPPMWDMHSFSGGFLVENTRENQSSGYTCQCCNLVSLDRLKGVAVACK